MRKIFALFGTISIEGVEKISAQLEGFDKKMKNLSKDLGKAGRKMQSVGKNLTTHLTLPVAAASAAIVKYGADFDKSITTSTAIMKNVTKEQTEAMKQGARDVAKTTTFSAKEAGEAYYYLASAGKTAEQSIALMPKVANFAAAGQVDLARATDLLTDAQSALGLSSENTMEDQENMVRLSDALIGATISANATTEQFAESLTNKAAGAMRLVNMSVEEGLAVLAVFADQGIKGAEAGTQMSIVLRDLTNKAINNKEAFERFNVSVFDSNGNIREMSKIVGDLENAMSGLSDEQKKATLMQMGFTDKSVASILALIGFSDKIDENYQKFKKFQGITDEVTQKQLQAFWAQLTLVKNQLIDIAIELSEELLPIIKNKLLPLIKLAADVFMSFVRGFRSLPKFMKTASIAIVAFTALLGPMLVIGGKTLIFLASFRTSIIALRDSFMLLGGARPQVMGFLNVITNKFMGLSQILIRIAGPAGLVAAVGLAFVALGTTIKHFKDEYDDLKKVHESTLTIITAEELEMNKQVKLYEQIGESIKTLEQNKLLYGGTMEVLRADMLKLIEGNEDLKDSTKKTTAEMWNDIQQYFGKLHGAFTIESFNQKKRDDASKERQDQIKNESETYKYYSDADLQQLKTSLEEEVKELEEAEEAKNKVIIKGKKAPLTAEEALRPLMEKAEIENLQAAQDRRNEKEQEGIDNMKKWRLKAFEVEKEVNDQGLKDTSKILNQKLDNYRSIGKFTVDAATQVGNIMGALYAREQQTLDKNYEKNRQRIEDTIIDEDKKAEALTNLEEKYNKESNEIKKKQAIADKALALFQIAINTAIAVSQYLGQPWHIAGVIALGAAQAAAVAMQPIPLRKGGLVPGSEMGTLALLGEQNTKEMVLPLESGIQELTKGLVNSIGLLGNPDTNQPTATRNKSSSMGTSKQVVLNIGNFYGDEMWVKELTRKIIPVLNTENERKALAY